VDPLPENVGSIEHGSWGCADPVHVNMVTVQFIYSVTTQSYHTRTRRHTRTHTHRHTHTLGCISWKPINWFVSVAVWTERYFNNTAEIVSLAIMNLTCCSESQCITIGVVRNLSWEGGRLRLPTSRK